MNLSKLMTIWQSNNGSTLASVVHILSKYHEQPKKLSLGLNKVIGYLFYQLDQRIAGKEN